MSTTGHEIAGGKITRHFDEIADRLPSLHRHALDQAVPDASDKKLLCRLHDRRPRNKERRRRSPDRPEDVGVHPWRQCMVGILYVEFDRHRTSPRINCVGGPDNDAAKGPPWKCSNREARGRPFDKIADQPFGNRRR
jgi:hypothetical protein